MNETLQKINKMLKLFNETFEVNTDIDDEIVKGLKITSLKGDGSEFVNELFEIFQTIVSSSSEEHELIYNEEKGLVIAKKVIDYIIED